MDSTLPATYTSQANRPAGKDFVGNQECAHCHAGIVESYSRTAMARASGAALEGFSPADFLDGASGIHYRIYQEGGKVWLSFARLTGPSLAGKRELLYFIGSGRRGRTYLFQTDGLLFESPVNWYSDEQVWDMAPAHRRDRELALNLPAFSSCLSCHVSQMQPPAKGTQNRYPLPAFLQDGVGCERCHGAGGRHAEGGPIVNPAKLPPERRDQVCMQCHLEGKVAIQRPGKHLYDYQPGEDLSDFVRNFVATNAQGGSLGALSQFEALAQSACKKKSGDAMSCLSCHDPHSSPSKDERVMFYRQKCLACHGSHFGVSHHPEQPDCTSCHMPASRSTDIAHTQVTDHRVPRYAKTVEGPEKEDFRLALFPHASETSHDLRDLALAWESLAESGTDGAEPKAERLLQRAIKTNPSDERILAGLAYIALKKGEIEKARVLYEKALQINPQLLDAADNLGVIYARQGKLQRALTLWWQAFQRAPGQSQIGMNIAVVLCQGGKVGPAKNILNRVLEFNPDLGSAKASLQAITRNPANCAQ